MKKVAFKISLIMLALTVWFPGGVSANNESPVLSIEDLSPQELEHLKMLKEDVYEEHIPNENPLVRSNQTHKRWGQLDGWQMRVRATTCNRTRHWTRAEFRALGVPAVASSGKRWSPSGSSCSAANSGWRNITWLAAVGYRNYSSWGYN